MSEPSEREKQALSRIIPDEPGTHSFEVKRVVVTWPDGSENVIHERQLAWEPNGTVRHERRTITVTNSPWVSAELDRSGPDAHR